MFTSKMRVGIGWLTVAAMLLLVLLVVTARPDGAQASDGEALLANIVGIAMTVSGALGLAFIAWSLRRD